MNTRRMNRLEELGRVDAEKAFTKKGARNLKDEKKRIVRELKATGGKVKKKKENPMKEDRAKEGKKAKYRKMGFGKMMDKGEIKFAKGGSALKPVKPSQKGLKKLPTKVRNKMGYMKKGGRVGMGKALRGGGCVR
jgi:hypothetical protein